MSYEIFVEIRSDLGREIRQRLVAAAYRASRSNSVAFVLRDVSPEEADRVLDPVVREEGIGEARVDYLDPETVRSMLRSDGVESRLVLTDDPGWLEDAVGLDVQVETTEAGLRRLEGNGAGPG